MIFVWLFLLGEATFLGYELYRVLTRKRRAQRIAAEYRAFMASVGRGK